MGNVRVLPVLAVEEQHLLVNENGSIIQVQNNVQRQVTPGDYVNVEDTLGQDKAVGVAREGDPPETQSQHEDPTEFDVTDNDRGHDFLLEWGNRAPAFATDQLDGKTITVGTNFNKQLIQKGYARMYDSSLDTALKVRQP